MFMSLESPLLFSGQLPLETLFPRIVHFIDSHMHLEVSLKRTGCTSMAEYENYYGRPDFRLRAAVANFVYPDLWGWADMITESRVIFTFGVHPHLTHQGCSMLLLTAMPPRLSTTAGVPDHCAPYD
jgi:hypothetical protein